MDTNNNNNNTDEGTSQPSLDVKAWGRKKR